MKRVLSLALSVIGIISVQAQAPSLIDTIKSIPELSNLSTYLQPYTKQFADLTDITFIAPNNDAVAEFLNSSTAATVGTQPDLLQAILVSQLQIVRFMLLHL